MTVLMINRQNLRLSLIVQFPRRLNKIIAYIFLKEYLNQDTKIISIGNIITMNIYIQFALVHSITYYTILHYITCNLSHSYLLKRRTCNMSLRKGMPFISCSTFFGSAVLKFNDLFNLELLE